MKDPNNGSRFLVISVDDASVKMIDENFNKVFVPSAYMASYKLIDTIPEIIDCITERLKLED